MNRHLLAGSCGPRPIGLLCLVLGLGFAAPAMASGGEPATPGAAPVADLQIAPRTGHFWLVPPRSSGGVRTFTIHNAGDEMTRVDAVKIDGRDAADFAVVRDECTNASVAARESCTVDVEAVPTDGGYKQASITVTPADPVAPVLRSAIKATVTPVFNVWRLDLGERLVGDPSAVGHVTFTNRLFGLATVRRLRLAGPDADEFELRDNGCSGTGFARGGHCPIDILFTPSSGGSKRAELVLTLESQGMTLDTSLPLVGAAQSFVAERVDFDSQRVGEASEASALTFTNRAATGLRLEPAAIVGADAADFRLGADECGSRLLAPGATCTVTVSFAPQAAGPRSAQLLFGAGGRWTVELTGTAMAPEPVPDDDGPAPDHQGDDADGSGDGDSPTPATPQQTAPALVAFGPPGAGPIVGKAALRARVTRRRFVVGVGSHAPRCAPHSRQLSIRAGAATHVRVSLRRRLDVRVTRNGCARVRRVTRVGKRLSSLLARRALRVRSGKASLRLSSRVLGKRLRPGLYELELVAIDSAGARSRPATITLAVLR